MGIKKASVRRAAPARKSVTRVKRVKRVAKPKKSTKTTKAVVRIHHHWKTSHYQNVLHFSIAPKYQPIKGFSFLEGTLALMLATFAFTILISNTSTDTNQAFEDNANSVSVHQSHHSELYNFFEHNREAGIFPQL